MSERCKDFIAHNVMSKKKCDVCSERKGVWKKVKSHIVQVMGELGV